MQPDVHSGAQGPLHQYFSAIWTFSNRIVEFAKECKVSLKKLHNWVLEWANFETSGSIVSVCKTIPVRLKPRAILSNSDYYNLYRE